MDKHKSACSNFLRCLKNINYFGVGVNFRFKNGKKYNSIFGATIFIIYLIFSVLYMSINFIYFLQRKWMNVISIQRFKEKAPNINFTNYSFTFAVGLDVGDPLITSKIYQYLDVGFSSVRLQKKNGTVYKVKNNLPLNPCNYSSFYNLHNDTLDILGLQIYYCPDLRN